MGVADAVKAILFEGNEIQTADAVAEAVVSYACALAAHRRTDEVTIPIVRGGIVVDCLLCLGASVVWATFPAPSGEFIVVPGAEEVAGELRRRLERLSLQWQER